MSKKQGARLLAGLSKLVEDQKRPNEEKSPPRNPKKIRICLDLTSPTAKKETAAEYFDKVLGASSLQDRFFEFQKFKKNCPKLLTTVQLDLVELVKKELKVEPVGVDVEHLNPAGSEPLLPALGNKLGLSVDRILAPPVTSCLLCSKQLTKHNPPVQVSLLSLLGPSLASKYTWRCRGCLNSPVQGCLLNFSFDPKNGNFLFCAEFHVLHCR